MKLGILGICISLLGFSLQNGNALTLGFATVGTLLALIGCFTGEK